MLDLVHLLGVWVYENGVVDDAVQLILDPVVCCTFLFLQTHHTLQQMLDLVLEALHALGGVGNGLQELLVFLLVLAEVGVAIGFDSLVEHNLYAFNNLILFAHLLRLVVLTEVCSCLSGVPNLADLFKDLRSDLLHLLAHSCEVATSLLGENISYVFRLRYLTDIAQILFEKLEGGVELCFNAFREQTGWNRLLLETRLFGY